jgi:DNA polymerase III alpha subunit
MGPLHVHSNYTLLQGTIPVESLVETAKNSGYNFVALTDTNNMYGFIKLAKKAEEENIKPVFGAYIDDPQYPEHYAIFLAKNNNGYSTLCRIITTRKLKEDFSLAELLLTELADLFIIISSLELLEKIKFCKNWDNIYAELIVTTGKKKNTRMLYEFAHTNNLKFIASYPVYFKSPEDFLLHKVVSAIRLNKTLTNLKDDELVDNEYYQRPPEEFARKWRSLPEAISNINYIVQNCNVDLELGKLKFPVFQQDKDESSFSCLWRVCFEGAAVRYVPLTNEAIERLQAELDLIRELNFCDYFLVVWDIVREARKRGILNIGRGSAGNSIAAYCLDLSKVDPLKHNLFFERFLNRGRKSPPDVDLDFSWKERDEIVRYVFEKYGYSRVAMISTTVTFKARSAFREVAKVFGISGEEISKYSKFIPWTRAQNLVNIAARYPETKSLNFELEPWKSIVNLASQLADFPRHLSIHPSGIVISPIPITNYVALEYAKNKGIGLIITQPDMYSIEDLGLIKIDLLSQRSLGVLRDTLSRINAGKDLSLPASSPKIFDFTEFSRKPDNKNRDN